jgi:hypothetical protein
LFRKISNNLLLGRQLTVRTYSAMSLRCFERGALRSLKRAGEIVKVPTVRSVTPCWPPSRRGLAIPELAAIAQRRPALTASAHAVHVRTQVGTKKRPLDRTKKLDQAKEALCSMLFVFLVQRPSDDFVHWFRFVYVGNISDAAAIWILTASAESGYFPVMMRAGVRAVFAQWHGQAPIISSHWASVP